MKKFEVIPQSQLSEKHFLEYPVWSEHYDWEEIEDIERWGLDRELVLKQFEENSIDNDHCVYTLLEVNPFPERMRIYISASLVCANGIKLTGYVVNESAYCLTVFFQGEEYIFSTHPLLASGNIEHAYELAKALQVAPESIFPIIYTTQYFSRKGEIIKGQFMYGVKNS